MKRIVLAALVIVLVTAPAMAGQNPDARAFISFMDPPAGADPYDHDTDTIAGLVNIYLLVDAFGEGGGMRTISLKWTTSGFGMAFAATMYLPGAQQIGGPDHVDEMWVISGDACTLPNEFGWVVVLNQPYFVSAAGTVTLSENTADGKMLVDCNFAADQFCVLGNGGLGMAPPAGDDPCNGTPVEMATWGSIKALYR